ncbi:MAG: nitroreductase family protein [Clostridiales bacterium]|nr:nitroreductase family protein [Clostridiales bacterium]
MDIINAINSRRSIRQFTGEVINDEQLQMILRAGFQAPSAHNIHPQEFIVVKDAEKLENVAKRHKYAKALSSSACGIIVCGDAEKQPREGLLNSDCSASIENMLLAAHGLGLGGVWIGLYPIESFTKLISEIFETPENIIPIGMIAVGYPENEKEFIDRYEDSKVHYDKW